MAAPVDNGVPQRDTKGYTLDSGARVDAHHVTEDTEGEVVTVTGSRQVRVGDVLVATNRPETWEVASADEWNAWGATEERETDAEPRGRDEDEDVDFGTVSDSDENLTGDFDPSDHSATEVKEYLARDDVSDTEKERVREAERNGHNRSSALR